MTEAAKRCGAMTSATSSHRDCKNRWVSQSGRRRRRRRWWWCATKEQWKHLYQTNSCSKAIYFCHMFCCYYYCLLFFFFCFCFLGLFCETRRDRSLRICDQCDQKKLPNVFKRLPKKDFTGKMIDFDTFTRIAKECGNFGQNNCYRRH